MIAKARFRLLFESLLNRKLTSKDGIEEGPKWRPMPETLKEFYRKAERVDSINRGHNRLYRPWEIERNNGYAIFMEENQSVVVWGFRTKDTAQDDPLIYQGTYLPNDQIEWFPEKVHCADWLVGMVHWQIVNGACFRFGACADVRRDLRRRLAAHWPHLLTFPSGPLEFYGRAGQTLCWCGRKSGGTILAAGRTVEDLRQIDAAMRIRWDYRVLDESED
jgi:hypothetical protein